MLVENIMKTIFFKEKIEGLSELEFGIYEEKNKFKINNPVFAEGFLGRFKMIKEAKQGREKFNYYIYGRSFWILVDLDIVKRLIRDLLQSMNFVGAGLYEEEKIAKEIFNLAIRIEEMDLMHYKMNFIDCTYSFKETKFEPLNLDNYFINAKEYENRSMLMETPIFDKFMLDIMSDDTEAVEFVLQYMGSCISGMQKLEKFALLMGQGSNGKSTLIKLLCSVVGDEYVETRDINKLDDRFCAQGLEKKKLLISTESTNKKEVSTETLKKLTTPNEKMFMDIKNEAAKTVELNLNLIFACNQPINFGKIDEQDKSVTRRLIVIPFNKIFKDDEKDRDLDSKLKSEIPGITLKLINAYEKLVKNNYILPKSELISMATDEYIEKNMYKRAPNVKIKKFIDMYLEKDDNYMMSIGYMYGKYQENTNDINMKEQTFAKEVRYIMPDREKKEPSKKEKIVLDKTGQECTRYFVGFKLKEENMRRILPNISIGNKDLLQIRNS